jgi:ribosomal-protein-alanine N-acetyltransferase
LNNKIKILKSKSWTDLKQILNIEVNSFHPIDWFSINTFKYFFKKKRLWVVIFKNKIIGYFILICYKKSLRVYSIALLPEYRYLGIGSKILTFIIKLAIFLNKHRIILEVRQSNKNKRLYEKFGFKVKKKLKNYYKNENGYKMELLLK